MIPLADKTSPLADQLRRRLRAELPRESWHVADAVADSTHRLLEGGGALWRDERLIDFALARSLWAVGESEAAMRLLRSNPALESLPEDLRERLLTSIEFSGSAICLACVGALRLERWPSAGDRDVIRLSLDGTTLRDCLQSELLLRQTILPLLRAVRCVLPVRRKSILALELPSAVRSARDSVLQAARDWLRAEGADVELWCAA